MTTMHVTNEDLRDEVLTELDLDPSVASEHVAVTAEGGVVTLSGTVPTFFEKWAAEGAAKRVKGVKAVVERLDVDLVSGHLRDDADIARAVVDALAWDVTLPPTIQAMVRDGHVTLEGYVSWYYQRYNAATTVRRIKGVRGLSNQIAIKAPVGATNVLTNIEAVFERDALLDAAGIEVEAEGPKVILKGSVRSWFERAEATRAAWSVPGVSAVDNRLVVF
ncbi:MAG TPA: BON domain-containing protein [Candidatus Baltobacteraceae bacterium]